MKKLLFCLIAAGAAAMATPASARVLTDVDACRRRPM